MKKLVWMAFLLLLPGFASADDSGLGIELGVEKEFNKQLSASLDGEFRTQDGLSSVDRWSIGASVEYKITKALEVDAGYQLMRRQTLSYYSSTGKYRYPSYWRARQRAFASVTGSLKLGSYLELSLRERYQFTHRPSTNLTRYEVSTNEASLKFKDENKENMLRSRLQGKLKFGKSCPWRPFASIELLNDFDARLALDQTRYTLGTDYKLNKRNSFSLSYRYKDKSNADEEKGHLVSVGYKYTFK